MVHGSSHTLFVGVDEFDVPMRSFICAGAKKCPGRNDLSKASEIERIFRDRFFQHLECGCYTSIWKLLLTGVIPAFPSPVERMEPLSKDISAMREVHGMCGLSELEVRTMAHTFMPMSSERPVADVVADIRRRYHGYSFYRPSNSSASGSHPPLLYNPEQVKSYLQTLSHKGASIKRSTKKKTASVTHSLLKSSSYPFAADLSVAIDKLSQGLSVEAVISTNIQGSDLQKVGTEAWFTLSYYVCVSY